MASFKTDSEDEEGDLGGCHEIVEVSYSSIELTRVIDQNRAVIAENVEIEVKDIAQGNIFKGAPDSEDY